MNYRQVYELGKSRLEEADVAEAALDARILLICGTGDEAWPSDYSVNYMKQRLEEAEYLQ